MPSTRRRARTRLRVPRLSAIGWLLTALAAWIAVNTWPIQVAATLILLAAAGIALSVRGRRRYRRALRIPRPRRPRAHSSLPRYRAMTPGEFEEATARLAMQDPGVYRATVVGGAGDRAADVLVALRDGRTVMIQCKRYGPKRPVDADTLYSVNGTYREWHGADAAVVVTTSRFTASALEFAARVGIGLVDGPGLLAWERGGPPPWA